jgi:hypothetical protein
MIETVLLVLISVVSLRGENKGWSEFGISIQGTNACHNVTKIYVEGLPANYDLFSDECGTIWKVIVNDLIEIYCILVRESQALVNLWVLMRSRTV